LRNETPTKIHILERGPTSIGFERDLNAGPKPEMESAQRGIDWERERERERGREGERERTACTDGVLRREIGKKKKLGDVLPPRTFMGKI
jgi:hypothetical protein